MIYFNPCFHNYVWISSWAFVLHCTGQNGWWLVSGSRFQKGYWLWSIAINLSKAFDSICHNLLLVKLRAYGIGEEAIDFLHSYLSGWMQRVKVNGVFTDWLPVYCGVPQGHSCLCIYQRSEFFCSTLFPEALCWWHYRLCIQYRHFSIGTVS